MAEAEDNNPSERLVKIELNDATEPRRSAEAEQERAIAIYDILEENKFGLPNQQKPKHVYQIWVRFIVSQSNKIQQRSKFTTEQLSRN